MQPVAPPDKDPRKESSCPSAEGQSESHAVGTDRALFFVPLEEVGCWGTSEGRQGEEKRGRKEKGESFKNISLCNHFNRALIVRLT